jgi:hypothetical protein
VREELAQRDRLLVGELLRLLLRELLLVGLTEGVGLLLPVLLPVPETVVLWLELQLTVGLPLGELEGLAPLLREAVGEEDREALRLLLLEGLSAALPLPLCV